eukprot:PhM_4_TR9416/c0_g1_i1/m.12579
MHKLTLLLLVAVFAVATASAAGTCHNSTGACHYNGKYECADGSLVAWEKRCDGVEDCADGADEFVCPRHLGAGGDSKAKVHELMNCGPTCACAGSISIVASSSPFFQMALTAPIWDGGAAGNLMTGTPVNGLWGCNPAKTTAVTMMWYRKGSENCVGNTRKGGFICCGRAIKCTCSSGTS